MGQALGHSIGNFTIVHAGSAINVRLYQGDRDEQFDFKGPMTAEYAWAEQDEDGDYIDTDDPGLVEFEHDDSSRAVGEMAILAMDEIVDSRVPDGAEF